ncbi:EAL domain-containing protein [Parasedimentitalea maritima]|uniref:EAL domain-containing protein n=1 Tax=Parasedimentitalea maritima TaxID=2578117 RepID=A0A6A4RIU0_9RHOB|nr:EAL domain-containing protein [Zongyanglinia marina]
MRGGAVQDYLAEPKTSDVRKTFMCAVFAALLTAVGYFTIAWADDKAINERERLQLIKMTNSFVTIYSQNRKTGSTVPATFRRLGIEHFSNSGLSGDDQENTSVTVPGRPGLELGLTAQTLHQEDMIEHFVNNPSAPPIHEHKFEGGRLIGRTVVPSVANTASCVSCHNNLLEEEVYQLGDVMGAYIVERDLTSNLIADIKYSGMWFVSSLLIFWLLGSRERNHNINALRLESRVHIEKMKNEAEAKEKFLLSHDSLTGLPNRKLFNDYLSDALERDQNENLNAALIDLDEFKSVNDTMGHAAGDALLVEVAARLNECLRDVNGIVARLGGDEFAIVWDAECRLGEPDALAQRILNAMAKPMEFEKWQVAPKCSIGIATWANIHSNTQADFLKSADAALYVAKGRGKNTYQLFDRAIDASIIRQNKIAARLPLSIHEGELRIVMQPKVLLHDGSFKGFETLSRWRLNGEDISPEEFVAVAENTGSIRELDLRVMHEAASFSTKLEQETGVAVPVAVNLSANTFRSGSLLEDIQDVLWETGLRPDRLTIEVTETAAIENWKLVQDVLYRLREIGVRAALDDFGTGYSSLAYLLRMKFDEIKIDREFVRDIKPDNDNHKLLQHIAEMAESLGVELVIEGIETEQQVELIRGSAHRIGQGYYFSRPLELDDARDYLSNTILDQSGDISSSA